MPISILKNLNHQQEEAVISKEKRICIIAGPGTGKTRTLIEKIFFSLEQNDGGKILVLTFGKKAINEIKKRVSERISEQPVELDISNIHSFCYLFIKKYYKLLDLESSVLICDDDQEKEIIKDAYRNLDIAFDTKILGKTKSRLRLKRLEMDVDLSALEEKILSLYLKKLKEKKIVDFIGLLINTREILATNEEVRTYQQNLYSSILVDEFQDINNIQWEIIQMLCSDNTNIFVVGDPNQSIYGFQGAKAEIMESLVESQEWKKIYLNINYRSNKNIIDTANNFITEPENLNHLVQNLLQVTKEGDNPVIIRKIDAAQIIKEIKSLHEKGTKLKDIAVLYRSNYVSAWLEKYLVEEKIPYEILGSYKFLDRSEIKDTLAYLKLILLKDDSSLLRTINLIKGVGAKTCDIIENKSFTEAKEIFELLEEVDNLEISLSKEKKNLLKEFINQIKKWENIIETENGSLADSINEILNSFSYWKYLMNLNEEREKNIEQLINICKEWEIQEASENKTIKHKMIDFLNYVNLIFEHKENKDKKGELVTLSSVHQAKGLEFKVVFFSYLNQNIIPSRAFKLENLIEEKRIFYVGITRAKDIMYLTYNASMSPFLKLVENRKMREKNNWIKFF